jgi:hypothetical protein
MADEQRIETTRQLVTSIITRAPHERVCLVQSRRR